MIDFTNHCFVCGKETGTQDQKKNNQLNLPVCDECFGTEEEKQAIDNLNEGIADGFVCGCI